MSQVVCAVVGHQPNRRHIWNDSINARAACKRCGFPMLRDIHAGWRAFEPRSDHDVRRLAYPGVNIAGTGMFTARANGAGLAADAPVLERDATHDESVTTRLEPGIARSNNIVSHESFFPAVDDAILLPHYDLATIARAGALAHAQPRGCVPVPDWLLNRAIDGQSELWVIEMPTEAFPEVAKVGDLIICRTRSGNPPELVDGALYLFLMGKQAALRRVTIEPDRITLMSGQQILHSVGTDFREMDNPKLRLLGRVVGALMVRSI